MSDKKKRLKKDLKNVKDEIRVRSNFHDRDNIDYLTGKPKIKLHGTEKDFNKASKKKRGILNKLKKLKKLR